MTGEPFDSFFTYPGPSLGRFMGGYITNEKNNLHYKSRKKYQGYECIPPGALGTLVVFLGMRYISGITTWSLGMLIKHTIQDSIKRIIYIALIKKEREHLSPSLLNRQLSLEIRRCFGCNITDTTELLNAKLVITVFPRFSYDINMEQRLVCDSLIQRLKSIGSLGIT